MILRNQSLWLSVLILHIAISDKSEDSLFTLLHLQYLKMAKVLEYPLDFPTDAI